jgi:4-hydroxy-2-oxoglutarate aldolase
MWLFLYNMPANTGINLSPALTVRLAAHSNVAGIKDSTFSASQLAAIAAEMPKDFRLFAGRGSMLLATLLLGGRGGTLTVANVAPEFCVALYEAWCAGDLERARRMQFSLLPLNEAVTVRFGPAGIKAALDLAGYRGGPCRKPLLPLASDQKEELKRILERFTEDARDLR